MKIEIEIENNLYQTLENIAKGQYKSVPEYCVYYIEKYLNRELKNAVIQKIENINKKDLHTYIDAINNGISLIETPKIAEVEIPVDSPEIKV